MTFAHTRYDHRTQLVREHLKDNKAEVHIEGQHQHIYLGPDKKKHLVIEGTVTNFTDQPVAYLDASIGGRHECEVITLNPHSPVIKQQYDEFLAELIIHAKDKPLTRLNLLQYVNTFIQKKLGGPGTKKVEDDANKVFPLYAGQAHKFENVPVIPLEEFLKRKIGSCRHRALLAAYLLDRLTKEPLPPASIKGKVFYHQQGYANNTGHNFVVYQDDSDHKLYLVDPMWNKAIEITNGINIIEEGYGEEFKQLVMAGRYNEKHDIKEVIRSSDHKPTLNLPVEYVSNPPSANLLIQDRKPSIEDITNGRLLIPNHEPLVTTADVPVSLKISAQFNALTPPLQQEMLELLLQALLKSNSPKDRQTMNINTFFATSQTKTVIKEYKNIYSLNKNQYK